MNRRSFFKFAGAAVAGIALEKAIPLGRVWSFPKQIEVKNAGFDFYDLRAAAKPIYPTPAFDGEYYAIDWPVASREWTFGVYVHEVLAHYGQLQNMKAIALEAA